MSFVLNAAFQFGRQRYDFPGPLETARDVIIPRGNPETVANALLAAGAIRRAFDFRVAAEITRRDGSLHAGEFRFPLGASLRDVLRVLRTAKPVEHHVTIPEGLTAAQIAQVLDHADALSGDTPVPPEGAMLPETYSFERGTTRAALATRATAAMDRALAEIWGGRDPGLPLDTPRDLLILASIVERETARPEERPRVCAVFLNRLKLGMKLQSDPTTIYAVSGGSGVLSRLLSRADLAMVNPYNTYQATGLPPGPIDSPGVATMIACAHPSATDDLYFVADGTGHHAFARTMEEHNRNVARWRAINAAPSPEAAGATTTTTTH